MHVIWLAKLKSKIQKPLLEFFRQPRTGGEATDEKCELLMINKEQFKNIRYTNRIDRKALAEVIPDGVHRGLDRRFKECRNLCAVCENV